MGGESFLEAIHFPYTVHIWQTNSLLSGYIRVAGIASKYLGNAYAKTYY